ncbi:mitochondrial peripheral inner membrane protein [Orbilia oligospora]|uniref:Mitochondrial peripheral inner membrane protein n=1 Tax=Orbilia oligospora TaxID=2813651 RepID=A0A7C8JZ85_ORBOL|nr:mitochondrial peripheral inner membrane protein [Orbilia oligospora]
MLPRSILRTRPHLPQRCSALTSNLPANRAPLNLIQSIRLATTNFKPRSRPSHLSPPPPPPPRARPFYTTPFFTIPTAFILGYITYTYTTTPTIPYPINPYSFTPHVITSTTPLSPTSSLITLSPKYHSTPPPSFWSIINSEGLCNGSGKRDRNLDNKITIFVRAVDGGEVSPYLLSRKPGDVVEVRGPVITYTFKPEETVKGEEDIRNVVFIAGGTGVSPAIQLTAHLFSRYTEDGIKRQVKILFASRTASEEILPQIQELQKLGDSERAGIKVDVEYFYDDKDSFITKPDIEAAVAGLEMGSGRGSGRDVIMVSGPEGFVNHYAGKKGWKDGLETQGVLGGVVGEILKSRKQGGKIEVMKL